MAVLISILVFTSGVLGLFIGSFLNVVAIRVPVGASLIREKRCPQCNAAIKQWHKIPVVGWLILRGRCASCRQDVSRRDPIVEAGSGAMFAIVAWLVLSSSSSGFAATLTVLLAYLYFAAISIALTLVDLDTHRLPDAIVLPSYVVAAALLTLACALGAGWSSLLGAGIGMSVLFAFYFGIRFIRPDGMGGGDVKLAGLIGLYLGWLGWGALAIGAFAAFVLGGLFGLALIASRRAGRRTAIPFGPWMLAGAWVGILIGEAVGAWYLDLLAA